MLNIAVDYFIEIKSTRRSDFFGKQLQGIVNFFWEKIQGLWFFWGKNYKAYPHVILGGKPCIFSQI